MNNIQTVLIPEYNGLAEPKIEVVHPMAHFLPVDLIASMKLRLFRRLEFS